MDNAYKLLYHAFGVFLFCIALSCLFLGYRNYEDIIQLFNQNLKTEILYEQSLDVKESYYTKGKIIAILLSQLDYDVEIDGVYISKWDNIKDKIETYPIGNKNYDKSYLYDSDGNILRVIFRSI